MGSLTYILKQIQYKLTTIFLYITTFEDFLTCYWVSPTWRRLLTNYFFSRLSSTLANNPPFSTFPCLKFKILTFGEKRIDFSTHHQIQCFQSIRFHFYTWCIIWTTSTSPLESSDQSTLTMLVCICLYKMYDNNILIYSNKS